MEEKVKAKKHLGQHFLRDENIARKIVDSFLKNFDGNCCIEVGPGMGVLTKYLIEKEVNFFAFDVDHESVAYLKATYPSHANQFCYQDFLAADFSQYSSSTVSILGNFPYNISSQILFKAIDNCSQVPQLCGMFQKEVAERIAAKHNTKTYGILSVLMQTFYDVKYLFTVNENVFNPPPKVKSAVIDCVRKPAIDLGCSEAHYKLVIKTAFNQRRKQMRNSLKSIIKDESILTNPVFDNRPEQLTVKEFIDLARLMA